MKEKRRLFLALPIPVELKEEILRRRSEVDLSFKWIPAENLHVTVLFLGSVPEEKLQTIVDQTESAVRGYTPFELKLKGLKIQKGKFQYTLEDGNNMAEIYATEKFHEKQLVYQSKNEWIGNASKTQKYEYAFTAAIVPLTVKEEQPWSVVLMNRYDVADNKNKGIFERPYVEEEGYATNGKENIAIRPLRIEKMTTASGKETKVFGGKLLSGYELRWDNGVVGIVDILDNNVWIYNDLEPKEKLILASISSALLLKRMQDVEKDKDAFDK